MYNTSNTKQHNNLFKQRKPQRNHHTIANKKTRIPTLVQNWESMSIVCRRVLHGLVLHCELIVLHFSFNNCNECLSIGNRSCHACVYKSLCFLLICVVDVGHSCSCVLLPVVCGRLQRRGVNVFWFVWIPQKKQQATTQHGTKTWNKKTQRKHTQNTK